ncbi:MAG TPA: rod shape-determining protein MreD [Vicinamibacterales bacterium]|nr:rod shape-determining protein MreD [Vicinamibacterales bacterium]
MKIAWVLGTLLAAVVLQAALARYTVGGRWVFDLVLVGVVYCALQWGAAAGMAAGTLGGLFQDLLSGGLVGVGGFAKTLVGYATGVFGTQFVLAKPQVRAAIVAASTVVHRLTIVGMNALIDQWQGVPWTPLLVETLLNSMVALVVFHVTEMLPGVVERGRASRRSSLSRRQW